MTHSFQNQTIIIWYRVNINYSVGHIIIYNVYIITCMWNILLLSYYLSTGTPVSATNINDRHDIRILLMKVVLNTINLT